MKDDTLLIHSGKEPFHHYGIVNMPVYRASTVLFPTIDAFKGRGSGNDRYRGVRYGACGTPSTFALADGYASGWASMDLSRFITPENPLGVPNELATEGTAVYTGLPVIGFAATRLANGNVGVGAAYANTIPHRYVRSIAASGSTAP